MKIRIVAVTALLLLFTCAVLTPTEVVALGSGEKSPDEKAEKELKDATKEYNKGVELQKKAKELVERGDTNKAIKELKEAAEKYEKAVEKYDSLPEAWSNLGYSLRVLGDYEAALAAYHKALQLKPEFPEALEYRGRAYIALGWLDSALIDYQHLAPMDTALGVQLWLAIQEAQREGKGKNTGAGW